MKILIKEIEISNIPAIVGLMSDFARFEHLEDYFEVTEDRLAAAMFGETGFVNGLIAFGDGEPIGYALFFPYFASFRGQRGLYLEDIYIQEHYRGKGIGEAMLKRLASIAAERGAERIDFMVLEWNTPAVTFYKKLGAVMDDDERHFKFTDEAFKALAG